MKKIELYETRRWLETAGIGEKVIYWRGLLAVDKLGNNQLAMTAAALMKLSNVPVVVRATGYISHDREPAGAGRVRLFQRRAKDSDAFEYIVSIIHRPTKADLDTVFK